MTEHQPFFNTYKPKSTQGIFTHVMHQLDDVSPGVSIDLCCGTGRLVSNLKDEGYTAIGFDISSSFIGNDSKNTKDFVVADVNKVPVASGQAELVTFIDSLQYFDRPDAMIAETARLLKPGGYLILSCQNNYNPAGIKKWLMQAITGKVWSPWMAHPYENALTYPQIIDMLVAAGYEIDYIRGKQFLTAWVSLLPRFIRNVSLWKDKPWRSLSGVASRISLPDAIEESFLARFAMIVFIRARKK